MIASLGPSVFQQMGLVIILIITITEWAKGQELKMEAVVPVLATVFLLFNSTNFFMYFGVVTIVQFLAILDRLASIFEMEEYRSNRDVTAEEDQIGIEAVDADFSWGFKVQDNQADAKRGKKLTQADEKVIVSGVNFKMSSKDLMVVVGMVGAGKSTLLHSIMGESLLVKGSLSVKGTIAYVEQEPFILSASVKDNILLGKRPNEDLLKKAIQVS